MTIYKNKLLVKMSLSELETAIIAVNYKILEKWPKYREKNGYTLKEIHSYLCDEFGIKSYENKLYHDNLSKLGKVRNSEVSLSRSQYDRIVELSDRIFNDIFNLKNAQEYEVKIKPKFENINQLLNY